jgi:hypothetical protein
VLLDLPSATPGQMNATGEIPVADVALQPPECLSRLIQLMDGVLLIIMLIASLGVGPPFIDLVVGTRS